MIYVRKDPCLMCGGPVVINTKAKTVSCQGCNTCPVTDEYLKSKDFEENYEFVCI